MNTVTGPIRVAVIGAGMAGAACAAGLRQAGVEATLFEKSGQVGGRMSNRRERWIDAAGVEQSAGFDHGASGFSAVRPRFRGVLAGAVAAGCASEWCLHVHSWRSGEAQRCFGAEPDMPALCSHLLAQATVHCDRTVRRLQKAADGRWYVAADGAALAGPFDRVVLALPPAQAAVLAAGHRDDWAGALAAKRMEPCWTLMAVTDDLDWPWDAAEPDSGPLAWVIRNDRLPGRTAPAGLAVWTAHATAQWSAAHLDAPAKDVSEAMKVALASQLPRIAASGSPPRWHHANVHRWRYAGPSYDCDDSFDSEAAWWDPSLGLGVCGDFLGGGGVEGAWHSGDELADAMAASFEHHADTRAVPGRDERVAEPGLSTLRATARLSDFS